jgi:hypothetical protein
LVAPPKNSKAYQYFLRVDPSLTRLVLFLHSSCTAVPTMNPDVSLWIILSSKVVRVLCSKSRFVSRTFQPVVISTNFSKSWVQRDHSDRHLLVTAPLLGTRDEWGFTEDDWEYQRTEFEPVLRLRFSRLRPLWQSLKLSIALVHFRKLVLV